MTRNSYLQVTYHQFSTKSVITSERLGPASRKFVDGLRSYNKIKIKKELGKSTKNSYLQVICNYFSTKSDITLERLGAASRKFIDKFRSYKKRE